MIISIFFILFMLFMAVIAIGSSLLRGVLSLFFGRRSPYSHHTTQGSRTQSQAGNNTKRSNRSAQTSDKNRKKIFDASEGEYVDFEEIKE